MTSLRLWPLTAAMLLAVPAAASAQAWPERTIQAIVPFAAGAANDIVGRIVLEQVSKQVGQPMGYEMRRALAEFAQARPYLLALLRPAEAIVNRGPDERAPSAVRRERFFIWPT